MRLSLGDHIAFLQTRKRWNFFLQHYDKQHHREILQQILACKIKLLYLFAASANILKADLPSTLCNREYTIP